METEKKKILIKVFFFVILLFLVFQGVPADAVSGIPSILSYQGRLTNSNGDLVGGSGTSYNFKFSIWNVATGGTSGTNRLWPSTDPLSFTTTVRQGVFNVNIGDTDSSYGFPQTLDYNFNTNKDIYLQVEVFNGTTFEPLTPRQRISSAPFAQVAGAVSGLGQSSFGTTTPTANSVVSIESTSTNSTPLSIRGIANQLANLFQVQDSSLNHLFSIDALGGISASSTLVVGTSTGATSFIVHSSGNVGVGTSSPSRKLSVSDVNSDAQLRLSQSGSNYGDFLVDSLGDLRLSLPAVTGGNFRLQDQNLWVCSGDACGVDTPNDKGNIIVETAVIFNNKFKFKLKENTGATTTTVMLDSTGNEILEFDEGQ